MKKRKNSGVMSSGIIIGASDGPTSIFIAGKTKKFTNYFRKKISEYKRKKLLKALTPNPRSLEEVGAYITENYHAKEAAPTSRGYQESFRSLKASFVTKYRPELLGEPLESYRPENIKEEKPLLLYLKKSLEYTQKAEDIPDALFPMDFHIYEITLEDEGTVTIDMDFIHNFLGVSYTCKKGKQKSVKSVQQDIYYYYGVSQEDIDTRSERFQTLLAALLS